MKSYYVYQYLREDGTPYYIGKGKGDRAWVKHQVSLPTTPDRIQIIKENLSESDALALEIELIGKYGRKDINTGILRNMTDGGEGTSGYQHKENSRKRISESRMGEKNPMYGKSPTPAHSRKLSLAKIGKPSNAKGKKYSEETRQNYKKAAIMRAKDPLINAKISNSLKGIKRSEETRKKMAEAAKLREAKKKLSTN